MKRKFIIELSYDDEIMHSGTEDAEAKEWFDNDILMSEEHILHNNEIGDSVGKVRVLYGYEQVEEFIRHKASCPISRAWGSGPGGTGIKRECGLETLLGSEYGYQAPRKIWNRD